MFARLIGWGVPEPTRFEKHKEFTQVTSILAELVCKAAKLKAIADQQGADSLAYQKNAILQSLLKDTGNIIEQFNQSKQEDDKSDEIEKMVDVVRALIVPASATMRNHGSILAQKRNSNQDLAKLGTQFGVFGVPIAAGLYFALPALLTFLGTLFFVGNVGDYIVKTDAFKKGTASEDMVNRLLVTLRAIEKNLKLKLELDNDNNGEILLEGESPLECMITREVMQDAVFCTLDGQTYEREAITAWLTNNRTSPHNRNELELADGVSIETAVESVLMPNYAVMSMIAELRKQNKNHDNNELPAEMDGMKPA